MTVLLIIYLAALAVCLIIAIGGAIIAVRAIIKLRREGKAYRHAILLGAILCLPLVFLGTPAVVLYFHYRISMSGANASLSMGSLLESVHNGDSAALAQAIDEGADINEVHESYRYMTPLYLAAEERRLPIVNQLLTAGADVNGLAGHQRTPPLFPAVANDDSAMVKLLLDKGADPNANGAGMTALIYAAHHCSDPAIVGLLLEHNAQVNVSHFGSSPLHIVTKRDNIAGRPDPFEHRLQFVRLLVENGARVDSRDRKGHTAVDLARERGHHEILEYLINLPKTPESE